MNPDSNQSKLDKLREEKKNIQNAIREKLVGYILAAFGLVAAFAWNDAVKSAIEYFFPLGSGTLLPKFLYALAVTIIVVIASYYISKFFTKSETEGK